MMSERLNFWPGRVRSSRRTTCSCVRSFPLITTLSMVFSFTLGANVLVEKVFSWPGIGSYAIEALVVSDYAAVQGFVLAMAVLFVLLNLTVDIVHSLVDPRTGRQT